MLAEVDIYGILIPTILMQMVLAFAISGVLRKVLTWLGVYRLIWHRSLFSFALYIIVLGGTVTLTGGWF